MPSKSLVVKPAVPGTSNSSNQHIGDQNPEDDTAAPATTATAAENNLGDDDNSNNSGGNEIPQVACE